MGKSKKGSKTKNDAVSATGKARKSEEVAVLASDKNSDKTSDTDGDYVKNSWSLNINATEFKPSTSSAGWVSEKPSSELDSGTDNNTRLEKEESKEWERMESRSKRDNSVKNDKSYSYDRRNTQEDYNRGESYQKRYNKKEERDQTQSQARDRPNDHYKNSRRSGSFRKEGQESEERPGKRRTRDEDKRENSYSKELSDYVNRQDGSSGRHSEPFRRNYKEGRERGDNKRLSFNDSARNKGTDRETFNKRRDYRREDDEFLSYQDEFKAHKGKIDYARTTEVVSDLFQMPEAYSLVHCVAEDMNMGSGIAVQFRYKFKQVDTLLSQRQRTGGLALLPDKERFIYYLVTKRFSSGKPTYSTLFSSLKKLRQHVVHQSVQKLAMPRIGCGLDRLEWDEVKFMIEFIFKEVEVDIVVCNLEPTEDSSPSQKHRNCKLTNETYPIENIEGETVILYFTSEDEAVSPEMEKLDEKLHFMTEFRCVRKMLGNPIIYNKNPKYLLCGCVVRKEKSDFFDFVAFMKCLSAIQKENRKTGFFYYAFQAVHDEDEVLNYKIINILRNTLRDVEVYVCWPGDLQRLMSPKDQYSDSRDDSFKSNSRDWRQSSHTNWKSKEKSQDESFDSSSQSENWRQPHADQKRKEKLDESFDSPSQSEEQHVEAVDAWFQTDTNPVQSGSKPIYTTANKAEQWWEPNVPSARRNPNLEPHATQSNEFEAFMKALENNNISCTNIQTQNPPVLPTKFARVCFAREDLIMETGVPTGSTIGPHIGTLLNFKQKEGGFISLKEGDNYLYCLIVNSASSPQIIFSAIQELKKHALSNNVRKLVVPQTGDELKCSYIKQMFQFLLRQCEITWAPFPVDCSFSQLCTKNKIKLVNSKAGVHQTKKKSIILYLASADLHFSEEMDSLAKKFDFAEQFRKTKATLGQVVRHKQDEDHVLYGCFVRTTSTADINFEKLQQCLHAVSKENKEKFGLIGIQATKNQDDNSKIATVLLHSLSGVTIYMCFPGPLKELIPNNI